MKTKLLMGLFAVAFSSCTWAIPTFDVQDKAISELTNFSNITSLDGVFRNSSYTDLTNFPENPLINIINNSMAKTEPGELENPNQFFDLFNVNSSEDVSAYALVSNSLDKRTLASQWEASRSPDVQFTHSGTVVVPAPGALLLGSIGAVIIGWLRKSRMISQH